MLGQEAGAENAMLDRKGIISVIICAYTLDRWDDLRLAVASVLTQERPADEVILVVDNNPELQRLAEAEFTGVRVVANEERQGLSGGRNTGMRLTHGDLVAFLDDDAVAEPTWLGAFEACFEDLRVLGATGYVAPHWIGEKPGWFPDEFLWTVGCSFKGAEAEKGGEVRNVMGCSMIFRRAVYERIGGFSHRLGRTEAGSNLLSCEETEYCIRARAAFPKGIFVSTLGAAVSHRVPARRVTFNYFVRRTYAEGISKAIVAALAPQPDALKTERSYVFGALSRAVFSGLGQGVTRFDRFALGRAGAVVVGLGSAAAGFLQTKLLGRARAATAKENARASVPQGEVGVGGTNG
jgi:GT2 family glycosyltransferase